VRLIERRLMVTHKLSQIRHYTGSTTD
jgi:hypothetical protein